jgi:ferric-dicitrate binding protein FerR (iron transport regulator)
MTDDGQTIRIVSVRVTAVGPKRRLDLADGSSQTFDSDAAVSAWLDDHYGAGNWMIDSEAD